MNRGKHYRNSFPGKILCQLFFLFLGLGCDAPLGANDSPAAEVAARIDQLCQWTGMLRVEEPKLERRSRTNGGGYSVDVLLQVGTTKERFVIDFLDDFQVGLFQPRNIDLGEISLGKDTVTDEKARADVLQAVRKLNDHLRWKLYGSAAIQRYRKGYIVTFLSVPKEQASRHFDPYFSFIVNRNGKIFAAFPGA
jgi:hypothetical protein